MKMKQWMVALIVFAVVFGGIGISMLTGLWATESDKVPVKFTTGEFAGEYNPDDIRGSYTFQNVADTFDIELSVLFDAFGVDPDTDGTAIKTKDIETAYGDAEIGNGSVKLFVALYKGLPFVLDGTYLTPRAAELVIAQNPNLTQTQLDYLAAYQVDMADIEAAEPVPDAEAPAAETLHDESELTVKGTTTFQQVLDLGLTQAQIEDILGLPMPAGNMLVRDFCTENSLSFSGIKAALNDALEAMK